MAAVLVREEGKTQQPIYFVSKAFQGVELRYSKLEKYAIIQGQLFKKGLSQPLLKCLHPDQTDYVLREVNEGCCCHHIGGKALARKLIRASYYWPSMMRDSQEFISVPCWFGHKAKILICGTPQTNGQVEAANKVILLGLKKRLDKEKGAWDDELASIFWSYRTTVQSSTGETPFHLTYGVDAMIPVEVGEPSPQLLLGGVEEVVEKDLVDEAREMAHLSKAALKQRMALRYNAKVLRREFEQNDLVLQRNDIRMPTHEEGKLAAKWEGPFRVKEKIGKGAYKLERLDGRKFPRTWNAGNLRRFYS
ncbi:uncharacterized protein LOC107483611 [Arachis duranensis]|uniref:Uncharacterized protein LOC107483611 n=1 Tax=Arachis duranensis TaxID=130453 RepID=A0A6P4CZX6_ARADU|nr:uncharacterized protein LOC107483611 [Arachis duranensis]